MALDPELLDEYLRTAFPNPERKGCPDEEVLKALAERQLSLSDPAMVHLASCSECYTEYRNYRLDLEQAPSRTLTTSPSPVREGEAKPAARVSKPQVAKAPSKIPQWTVAALLLVGLGIGFFYISEHRGQSGVLVSSSSGSPVNATVDLFNAVTSRVAGDEDSTPLQQVSLPSSIVHLTVTLPRLSERGPYKIVVAKDRAGRKVVAHGAGEATEADGKVSVSVTLDLRNTAPGMYFLATVRGSDNGTYYYPLQVH